MIKIVVVDDHTLFRSGLVSLLSEEPDFAVTAEASDGREFLSVLAGLPPTEFPDVVLLDIEMPAMNGIDAAAEAHTRYPALRIIALSMYADAVYYKKMMDAGASGYLLKNADIDEVSLAIHNVLRGDRYVSGEVTDLVLTSGRTASHSDALSARLSSREREILAHICAGLSNEQIGDKLFISKRTVEKHRANLLDKTGCHNTASLVLFALQNKLV